jgi:protoheme IX farnesyltransferase
MSLPVSPAPKDAVTTVDPRPRVTADAPAISRPSTVRAYIALTKPRIIELLLVTTVPTMILAAGGMPSLVTVAMTLLGGTLAAGSANTLNCFLDRDIDVVMRRTAQRPLATGQIPPRNAVVFGIALGVVAVAVLIATVNVLAAGLALAAILFYVFGYTLLLKRRTPQNIVWGGAAGCMPVLIGWAAVRNGLSWEPLVLFGVIFLWTPPHYWPLSMRFREDYAAAGVPMLPVVASEIAVARKVVLYSWAMVAWSLLLVPATGLVYLATAVLAGGMFLVEAYRLLGRTRRGEAKTAPMRLFHFSITYLTLLFTAVAIDPFLSISLF